MNTVKIAIHVDKTAAIKAGKSVFGRVVVELTEEELQQFTAEERELLAACPFGSDRETLELRTADPRMGYVQVSPPPVAEATAETVRYVLTGLEKNVQDEVAARASQREKNLELWVQKTADAPIEELYRVSNMSDGEWLFGMEAPGYYPGVEKEDVLNHPSLAARYEEAKQAAQVKIAAMRARWAEAKALAEAKKQEEEAKKKRRQEQIIEWVRDHGTESQVKRLDRGLLPEAEILAAIRASVFAPIADWPQYDKITDADVCDAYGVDTEYDTPATTYDQWRAEELSAEEFEAVEKVEALLPGAAVEVCIHRGRLKSSTEEDDEENQVLRKSIKVTAALGEIIVGRRLAL